MKPVRARLTAAALAAAAAVLPLLSGGPVAAASPAACGAGQFRVALDIGHTLSQPGAVSARGVTEFEYNRRLAQAVSTALGRLGIPVILIGLSGAPLRLHERTRLAQAAGAEVFLSLHHDSVQPRYLSTWIVDGQQRSYSDAFHGYSVFVSGQNARARESVVFATFLGEGLRGAGFTPSLHHAEPIPGEARPLLDPRIGLYRFDQLAVLRTAAMPAVLLEAAIIVNRDEEEQVRSAAFLDRLAASVANSVQRFCAAAAASARGGTGDGGFLLPRSTIGR